MKTESSLEKKWDRATLVVSGAVMVMATTVLVGWHAHLPTVVQLFPGLVPMQYNTALCFLALGTAGVGLVTRKRLLPLVGGIIAALMGGAVILEYATGRSFGIDTLFFYPWERALSADPGRMALTTAISFLLTGIAFTVLALRPAANALFGVANSVTVSLALTSLVGYCFHVTYVLPFSLGSQMAVLTATAFFAHGIVLLAYAWLRAKRGPDGLPVWGASISLALLPVLFVAAGTLFREQSWFAVSLEIILALLAVGLITLAIRALGTVRVAYKGLLMIAIPLIPLLVFVGLIINVKRQNESAEGLARHSTEVIDAAHALLAVVTEAEGAARGFVITDDTRFSEAFFAARELVAPQAARLRNLVRDNPHQAARAATIEEMAVEKTARLSHLVGLARTGDKPGAEAWVKEGTGAILMARLRLEMGAFIKAEEHLGAERQRLLETSWERLTWLLVAGTAGAILLAGILILSFSGSIGRRLRRLRENATSLAAGRELAPSLGGHDEIAELDRVFHQMAEALEEATRREKAVIEGTTDAIFIKDLNHRYLMINPAAAAVVGLPPAKIIGATNDDLIEADSARRIREKDNEVIASGRTITYEYSSTNKAGIARDYLTTRGPYRDRHNRIIGTTGVCRDITDKKRTEAAVIESDRRFREFFYDAPVGYHELDLEGRITCVNTTELQMLGYSSDEMVGHLVFEFLGDAAAGRAAFAEWLAGTKPPATFEGSFLRRNGTLVATQVDFRMIKDPAGCMMGIRATLQDITERKRAEAINKAGALQSAIFNSANFSSIATDAKGVIQIFNVGAERMLGYTAADVVNRITPADISDAREIVARAAALSVELDTPIQPGFEALVFKASRGIEDIYELTYIRKDGSRFPAVVSVTALRDGRKEIIGYLLIGTDNTARKAAEAALRKAGALQSAIFNSANFSSIATDEKGVIQIFNVGAERMLGYAAAEVLNKITPADISDPQEVIDRARALSAELATTITPGFEALVFKASRGIEDIYELTYIRKDGSRFPAVVSVTALRADDGQIIGYLLIGTDNTARKQVEEERGKLDQRLRDQQFYTRSLIESNIDALMTTDPQGIITDVNHQMETLTGCTRDELIGAPFRNCFTDPAQASAGITLVLNARKVTDYELTARARDGRETVVSYNASTFYDRDRRLQGVFAAARDITERKAAEILMSQGALQLQEANKELGAFSYSVSHDLRAPLRHVLGFVDLLQKDAGATLSPKSTRYLATITAAAKRMGLLIDDLLAFSRIGRAELQKSDVNLDLLVRETLLDFSAESKARHIDWSIASLPAIRADRSLLRMVLVNLLANAVKFTSGRAAAKIEIGQSPNGTGEDVFFVRDNGAGFDPQYTDKLFGVFQRLHSHDEFEGTGIGLANVQRIILRHGGRAWAEGAVDRGATFYFSIPKTKET